MVVIMIEYFVYGSLIILFIIGAIMFYKNSNPASHYSARVNIFFGLKGIKGNLNKSFKTLVNSETDNLISQTGINISGTAYQLIRYFIIFVWLLYLAYRYFFLKYDISLRFIALIIFWYITSPRLKFFGFKSPFALFIDVLSNNRKYKYNAEIYRCLSLLKNLSVNKNERPFPSTYIIEELSKYIVYLKPIFSRLLGYWYESRYEDGKEYFINAVGTDLGISLIDLLSHTDYLNPNELVNQLDHHQKKAKEKLKTRSYKIKELKSNFIYGIVMFAGLMIFTNFMVVSMIIDVFRDLSIIGF